MGGNQFDDAGTACSRPVASDRRGERLAPEADAEFVDLFRRESGRSSHPGLIEPVSIQRQPRQFEHEGGQFARLRVPPPRHRPSVVDDHIGHGLLPRRPAVAEADGIECPVQAGQVVSEVEEQGRALSVEDECGKPAQGLVAAPQVMQVYRQRSRRTILPQFSKGHQPALSLQAMVRMVRIDDDGFVYAVIETPPTHTIVNYAP